MDLWEALLLGVVEGLTEYLPVSSTGHLLLTQRALGIPFSEEANAFAICIQAGAILAVLGLYRARVRQGVDGLLGKSPEGRRLATNLVLAFLPAAVIGPLLDDWIEARLFGLWPVVAAWGVGGLVILAVARARTGSPKSAGRALEQLDSRTAFCIGLVQCAAMWPGTSRSLVTLSAGVLWGLSLSAAVEFSFLLGVITLTAATVYKGVQVGDDMLATYGAAPLVVGFVGAWLSAVCAVRWMVHYLKSHGLTLFGWYRVALALVVAALILGGYLASV